MFRFTQEPSSWIQSQCLAKITGMVPLTTMKISKRIFNFMYASIYVICLMQERYGVFTSYVSYTGSE
jgi:hypothetical protein